MNNLYYKKKPFYKEVVIFRDLRDQGGKRPMYKTGWMKRLTKNHTEKIYSRSDENYENNRK